MEVEGSSNVRSRESVAWDFKGALMSAVGKREFLLGLEASLVSNSKGVGMGTQGSSKVRSRESVNAYGLISTLGSRPDSGVAKLNFEESSDVRGRESVDICCGGVFGGAIEMRFKER